jgi:hypothetical protein
LKTSHYREAVWQLLQDGQWHSILDMIQVGGVRAAARVHELRHEENRRIVNRVIDGKSEYRYLCQCGPLPAEPTEDVLFCPDCRTELEAMGFAVPKPTTDQPEQHIGQLFLWGAS